MDNKEDTNNTDTNNEHPHIGKRVVLRCPQSGVFIGRLIKRDEFGFHVRNLQRVHTWSGALDSCTLAVTGPSDAKLSPKVPGITPVFPGRETYVMTPEARAAFERIGPWKR